MLVGDSHAAQWFPGFERASQKNGLKLRVATKSACPAVISNPNVAVTDPGCAIWENSILHYINASRPKLVVISNFTDGDVATYPELNADADAYLRSLINFISEISPGIRVAVIGDTPYPGRDSVACLSINWKNSSKCDLKNTKSEKTELTKKVVNYRTAFFDSRLYFCQGEKCPAVLNKKNMYRDGSHLSLSSIDIQEVLANKVLNLISSGNLQP